MNPLWIWERYNLLAVAIVFIGFVGCQLESPAFAQITFAPPVEYEIAEYPFFVVAVDIDKDLDFDVVIGSFTLGKISIFRNMGNGTFSSPEDYAVGQGPRAVAVADLDGDGNVDIAVANSTSNDISILMNTGSGSFTVTSHYPVGRFPSWIAAVDLDGDSRIDLAVANASGQSLSILKNRGGGVFGPAIELGLDRTVWSVAAGDLDGDGDIDLAVGDLDGDFKGIVLLFNEGDGAFKPPATLQDSDTGRIVIIADLDNDGCLDLAALRGVDSVWRYRNQCDGAFVVAGQDYLGSGAGPTGLVAADVDGDGDLDLVTSNEGANGISVLENVGPGAFLPARSFLAGSAPQALAMADFNGDSMVDVVTVNLGHCCLFNDASLSVLLNLTPPFEPPEPDIVVDPPKLRFFPTAVGGSHNMGFSIRNAGEKDLQVTAMSEIRSPFHFTDGPSIPFVVPPEQEVVFRISFTPTKPGRFRQQLIIRSTDPDEPEVRLTLTGRGVRPPR